MVSVADDHERNVALPSQNTKPKIRPNEHKTTYQPIPSQSPKGIKTVASMAARTLIESAMRIPNLEHTA
jgi:hypothetical protein